MAKTKPQDQQAPEGAAPAPGPSVAEGAGGRGGRWIALEPLSEIRFADRNPHDNDIGAIHGSVARFGFIEPPTIDERTGKLVAGHGRIVTLRHMKKDGQTPPEGVVLREDGEWLVPVLRGWASRTDHEAEAYLIASNRTAELAEWNEVGLAEMLKELAETRNLEGTGYDGDDVDAMLKKLTEELDTTPQLGDLEYRIVIDCESEQQQAELLARLEGEGLKVKALMS